MKSLLKKPLVALTGYLAQIIFMIWDKGSFVQDIIIFVFGNKLVGIPILTWIVLANIPLLFWLKNAIMNDLFFISHKLGILRNFNDIDLKYIKEENISNVIQYERKTYGSETWTLEQWKSFFERNGYIAIGAFDKNICIGGISIFPINEEIIDVFITSIIEQGVAIEENFQPEYISTQGSTFRNIYIPGIALLPYRFKYSGIGKYMIKKSILQFLRVYQENLDYPLTIYSIATSKFGSIFLKDYYKFTLAAGERNVFYKVFHTEELFENFVKDHTA
jgi:hypothetical protein